MARAAYPRMDDEAIDDLVLQKLVEMARGLRLVIQAVDDEDMCSLRAARSIHAHLMLDQDEPMTASATTSGPASRDDDRSPDRVFSTSRATGRRSPDRTRRRDDQERGRAFPRSDVTCFNCCRRGHVSSDCRAPRRRSSGSRDRDHRAPSTPRHKQASRGTPHARSSLTPHTPQRTVDFARDSAYDARCSGDSSRPLRPGQWSELAHRMVAATAGSSVVVGSIEGVELRVLVDTGCLTRLRLESPQGGLLTHPTCLPGCLTRLHQEAPQRVLLTHPTCLPGCLTRLHQESPQRGPLSLPTFLPGCLTSLQP
ncbi:unnamed protein product [Lampetra planeri]